MTDNFHPATHPEGRSTSKIRVVVFDADGVVITGQPLSERLKKLPGFDFNTFNTRLFTPDGVRVNDGTQEAPFRRSQANKYMDVRDILTYALSGTGWPGIDDPTTKEGAIDEFLKFWFEGDRVDKVLLQRIIEMRDRGVTPYMGTNQERHKAEYIRHTLGINEFGMSLSEVFGEQEGQPHIITSVEVGATKPSKEYYKALMAKIERQNPGITLGEVAFLDDDPKNVKAAANFGFYARLYQGIEDLDAVEELM